jgi:hypothetical protein
LADSTGYEAPHYAVVSNLLSLHPSSVQIFSTTTATHTAVVHSITYAVRGTPFNELQIRDLKKVWKAFLHATEFPKKGFVDRHLLQGLATGHQFRLQTSGVFSVV